jgi:KDO2-lipid IV(A) lauroyltransferase
MGRRRSTLRNVAEFLPSRSLLALSRLLPDAAVPGFARGLGTTLDAALAGRRRVVAENLRLAFGDGPGAPEVRAISRASFTNLCRSFLELQRLPRTRERFLERIRFRGGPEHDEAMALLKTGPIVFAASHFGAYEMAGITSSCLRVPLLTLVRPLDNPWLEAWLKSRRCRFGQRLASNRGGARELFEALDSGCSVAVLTDLNKRGRSVFVDYFGTPAATAPTAAQLALRTRRPLVPVFAHRTDRSMHFEIDFGTPLHPERSRPREAEIRRLLQGVTSDLERRVRADPAQWLWTHRRWKSRPAGEAAAAGPASSTLPPRGGEAVLT